MSDDRGGRRRTSATLAETAEPEAVQRAEHVAETFPEVEPVEDTVPYLPPLASYRIQGRWGEVRRGEPIVFPEDAAVLDEFEE